MPLTQGQFALIDADEAERVFAHQWCAVWTGWCYYAQASIDSKRTYLHRFIMDAADGEQIDHIDRDGLNCTKVNMRPATNAQNNSNKEKHPNNTSGYKGVYWQKARGRWMAYIDCKGKRISLGYYDDLEYAARVYDAAARTYHGEFARLNFPGESVEVATSTGGLRRDNIHGYRGITQNARGKWVAHLTVNKKLVHSSSHTTAEDAARAYDEAARTHLGDKAKLNFTS